jgi:hypothetical protein
MTFTKPARSALLISATLALALAGSVAIADPMSSDHMSGGGAATGAMSSDSMSSGSMSAHPMAAGSMGAHPKMAMKMRKHPSRRHKHADAMGGMAH